MITIKPIGEGVVKVTIESRSSLITASFGAPRAQACEITQRFLEESDKIVDLLDEVRAILTRPKPSSKE